MSIWQAALLGFVQGVTEFLPISSSGHLVFTQELLQVGQESFVLDVLLHFATLFAVAIFFWKDLWALRPKDILPLIIGSIPAALIGVLFNDQIESLFGSTAFIGWGFLITAAINFGSARILHTQASGEEKVSTLKGFRVGLAQAFAIMPAISRSGSTVFAGLQAGLDRTTAFKFSFMLSIPVILGANLLTLLDVYQAGEALPSFALLAAGGVAAFASGIGSLYLLRYMIKEAKFEYFGWYCLLLGLGVVGWQYFA